MVMANAYERYKTQEVTTASPMGLIVMLYNGCIKQLKLAQVAIDNRSYEDVNTHLGKGQNIISELVSSLDLQYPVSKDLLALYDFMLNEIVQANVSKDRDKLDPVIRMLSSLRDTWSQVEKTCRSPYELSES
jgi:flagellar protein FliS